MGEKNEDQFEFEFLKKQITDNYVRETKAASEWKEQEIKKLNEEYARLIKILQEDRDLSEKEISKQLTHLLGLHKSRKNQIEAAFKLRQTAAFNIFDNKIKSTSFSQQEMNEMLERIRGEMNMTTTNAIIREDEKQERKNRLAKLRGL